MRDVRKRSKKLTLTYPKEPLWERQLWNVCRRYEIKDGVLIEDGEPIRRYPPLRTPELPAELQRVARKELTIEEFAHQFGLLGHARLAGNYDKDDRDPTSWIMAQARTVHFCLHFIGLFGEHADAMMIRDELEGFSRGPYAWRENGLVRLDLYRQLADHAEDEDAEKLVRLHVSRFISENISGVRRMLITDARVTRVESMITFRSMIEAVYWQLADRIEGGVRRCKACKQFFVAQDKRQKFCPPWPGSTRSRCASRFNVQLFRSRH